MALKKCPRCELNYIREGEKYCNVCMRDMKGESDAEDTVHICTECGENPVVKGSELCAICLSEARRQKKLEISAEDMDDSHDLSIDSVELDEIEVPIPDDDEIPESELDEIDKCFAEEGDEKDIDLEDCDC